MPAEVEGVILLGMGPGLVSLLSLECAGALEVSHVVLVETLINRRALMLIADWATIKYVGRGFGENGSTLRGVLALVLRLSGGNVKVAWATNGDALTFNRACCKRTFIEANLIPYGIASGVTAATAAVGSAHSFGERPEGAIAACCNVRNITSGGVAVLYMMKNRFIRGADALIRRGYKSTCDLLMVQSVSAGGEKVSKLCLRQVTFVPPTEFTFGPLVTFVGCDGG
ncbi:MAG: SAM-dependent methyltransferase, partial [Candidatus Hodgkinia cicadicola]